MEPLQTTCLNGVSHQHALQDLTSSATLHHPAPREAIGDWILPATTVLLPRMVTQLPASLTGAHSHSMQSIDSQCVRELKIPPGKEEFQSMKTLPCQANQSAFPKLMTLDMRARAQPSAREAGF